MRTHVPGVHIPDAIVERLEGADNQAAEGKRLCVELIQQIREIEGVAGVHVMAYRQEEAVAEIIDELRRCLGRPRCRGIRGRDSRLSQPQRAAS